MMRRMVPVGPLALFLLAACAAQPTPYQPRDGAFGYAQAQLDGRTWRVDFAGNVDTPRETVENYLLYRAAEIMLFGGHERFVVLDKEVERTRDYRGAGPYPYRTGPGFGHRFGHGFGHGFGLGHHGRRGRRSHHHWRYGYAAPYAFPVDSYKAFATVRSYSGGPAPAGLRVYATREVIAWLGRSVILPE